MHLCYASTARTLVRCTRHLPVNLPTLRSISTEVLRRHRGPQPHLRTEKPPSTARFDDTFLLSEQVLRLLNRGQEEDATRLLSKNTRLEATVSWNYLLSHHFRKGAVNQAMHVFNDMKRNRAFPNELTYTTMLLGFADNFESGGRDKVRPMLESLVNDPRVKPNVIHLNAALKSATMSKDLTAAADYMNMMQDSGVSNFDSRTYTTLFLIYLRLLEDLDKRSTVSVRRFRADDREEKEKGRDTNQAATKQASRLLAEVKTIWQDVLSLARRKKLEIDDQLLSRYCYILARGDKADSVTVVELISHYCEIPSPLPGQKTAGKFPKPDLKMPLELNLLTPYWKAICQLNDIDNVRHCWQSITQAVPRQSLTRACYDVIFTHLYGYSDRNFVMSIVDQMAENKVQFTDRTMWLAARACSYYTSKEQARVTLKFYRDMADRFGREAVISGVNVMTMIEMLGKTDPRGGRSREYEQVDGVLRIIDGWDWVDNARMMLEHRKQDLCGKLEQRRDELFKITKKLHRRIRDQDKEAAFMRNRAQAVMDQLEEAKAKWPTEAALGRTTIPRDFDGRDKYGNRLRR
ncbi:hypothetical protein BCR37DRAFT_387724 [Protomyces lactucae-debilis]|uniref:Pentacotripeptide-repeat region of PRORP domain-containing protein n=1 Tax=Protomyces lactucae-debilis TaxID=2754530 RepID=A0A1Y2FBZ9_PROLT|nr:uncharacterized protein BCR37DRAFT_387724 [Protomyces lactucae-debilis]ORY81449.1 hypothetical protein BCR37DRAFT_387724 [Protomyces lactucae-debilis]